MYGLNSCFCRQQGSNVLLKSSRRIWPTGTTQEASVMVDLYLFITRPAGTWEIDDDRVPSKSKRMMDDGKQRIDVMPVSKSPYLE